MAQGLLGGVLPAIYSGADQLKRGVYGLLTNPMQSIENTASGLIGSHLENVDLWKQAHGNPNNPLEVTNQNALNMLSDRYLNNVVGFAPAGITAFHGTPHNILGKFDINKVGTGEGAQSYGHGMYFAEAPDVAKSYATDRSYVGKFMAGKPDTTPWDAQRIAQDTLNVHGDNAVAQLEKTLKNNSSSKNPQQIEANKQLQDAIDLLKTNQLTSKGNLYKVDIPDEYIPKMLDYDKPLKDQPKAVQDALAKYDPYLYSKNGDDYDPMETGQSIYQRITTTLAYGKSDVSNVYKESSDVLNSLGIKGIRYLDESSRSAGKGTSNFVVFDPTDVKILEKNSQPVEGLLD